MFRQFVSAFAVIIVQAGVSVPAFAQRPLQLGARPASGNLSARRAVQETTPPGAPYSDRKVIKYALVGGVIGAVAGAATSYALTRRSPHEGENAMAYVLLVPLGFAFGLVIGAFASPSGGGNARP